MLLIIIFISQGLYDLALHDLHVHSPFLIVGRLQHSHIQVINALSVFNIFKANLKSTCCCQKYQNRVQGDSERILISLEILAKLLFFNREIRRATAIRTSLSRSQRREIGWNFVIVKNKHILVSLSPPYDNHHYHNN